MQWRQGVRWRGLCAVAALVLMTTLSTPPVWGGPAPAASVPLDYVEATVPANSSYRPLPPFLNLRSPQQFVGSLPIRLDPSQPANGTTPVHLQLYGVVTDIVDDRVQLLFEFWWGEMTPLLEKAFPDNCRRADGHHCTDLLPHLRAPSFGDFRCEFVGPDGRVLAAEPTPVRAHEADLLTATTFVGVCSMPPEFQAMVAADDYVDAAPQVRVLRPGDPGAGAGAVAASPSGAFQADNQRQCLHLHRAKKGDESATACKALCLSNSREGPAAAAGGKGAGGCQIWQWSKRQCFMSDVVPKEKMCLNNDMWVGGRRRHQAWDAVDTARPERKRLITFGCSMPLFGDGTYMNRIPQWMEFMLFNFPDAHFFLYFRGGDGSGQFQHIHRGIPGVVGGAALLYPYVLARVATIVWVPKDADGIANGHKEAYQRRDENDYLYRARHLSEWASASVDYDEYFAPTRPLNVAEERVTKHGSHFRLKQAINADLSDKALADVFYPLHKFLGNVTDDVEEISFMKWPALIPDAADTLYLATNKISKRSTKGKMGKYIIRPLKVKLLWTHKPMVPESTGDLQKKSFAHLVVGNIEYNLLHFRDRDWDTVKGNDTLTEPYGITQKLAGIVERRLWTRYTSLPVTVPRAPPQTPFGGG